jgi:hypothetical protein
VASGVTCGLGEFSDDLKGCGWPLGVVGGHGGPEIYDVSCFHWYSY